MEDAHTSEAVFPQRISIKLVGLQPTGYMTTWE